MKKIYPKPELLAPAGSPEALTAAIAAGADAVYFGASAFNARMMAKNFEGDTLREAFRKCRYYGVKTNITLNILVHDREIRDMLACAEELYTLGADALAAAEKYALRLSGHTRELLTHETPKTADNVMVRITGSVRELCAAAATACRERGYAPEILTDCEQGVAREVGARLGALARENAAANTPRAFILGGETVVRLTGNGKGGRNQELALAAAAEIAKLPNAVVFSVGSDGTDGPTDAAGGLVDGGTVERLAAAGKTVADVLTDNDAYHALRDTGDLIITGPTGTNVNDFAAALVR